MLGFGLHSAGIGIPVSTSTGTFSGAVTVGGNLTVRSDLLVVNATQVLSRSNNLAQFSVGTAGSPWLDIQSTGIAHSITMTSSVASGSNGLLFNTAGCRLKFSSGGTTDYFLSDGATVISTPATLQLNSGIALRLSGTDTTRQIINNGSNNIAAGTIGSSTSDALLVAGTVSVNSTAVGNVGAGTDDLQTYALAANALNITGRGLKVTAWGTTANNANAKTVTLEFGSQTVMTQALTTNIAGTWRISAYILRTGSSTQDVFAELLQLSTILHKHTITAGTQTDSGAITIKTTGTATDNNDIVSEGLLVEYI